MFAVDVPSKSLLFHHADPLAIREALPKSKLLTHADYNVVVKHTLDATRVLRNLGIPAPAPIRYNYTWPGKFRPHAHQIEMAEFLTLHKKCFNLSEMGTEKTASSLWAADWLMTNSYVRKALILAPLSALDRTWLNEIFGVLMHRNAGILHGSRARRLQVLAADLDFYVINHDGLSIGAVHKALMARPDIDLVIVDEASAYINPSTDRYKALNKLVQGNRRLWMMTGTPTPNYPTDAWALARMVSPWRVPDHFGAFKDKTMQRLSQFKWAPRPEATQIVFDALQPAVRFAKKDCIDLPPVTVEDRTCPLTPEQTKALDTMRKEMKAQLQENQVTAVNAADKINKIRQILCGAVRDPISGQYIVLPHKPRLDVVRECIQQAAAKVLVIVPFKGIIQSLAEELSKEYTIGVLNGDVSMSKRNQIIKDFKTTPDPHVLLCHPQVMAHSLNLTEADTCVFYAPIYSNDQAQQVVERFNRSGQTRKMTVVRIGGHKLEWEIYSLIESRRLGQQKMLDLYREVAGGM